jgi:hypothetical protein
MQLIQHVCKWEAHMRVKGILAFLIVMTPNAATAAKPAPPIQPVTPSPILKLVNAVINGF